MMNGSTRRGGQGRVMTSSSIGARRKRKRLRRPPTWRCGRSRPHPLCQLNSSATPFAYASAHVLPCFCVGRAPCVWHEPRGVLHSSLSDANPGSRMERTCPSARLPTREGSRGDARRDPCDTRFVTWVASRPAIIRLRRPVINCQCCREGSGLGSGGTAPFRTH